MTIVGWIFCAVCALTSALAIGSLIAMLFYVYAEKREERERIAARMPHPAAKPDAAKECGVKQPPKFDALPFCRNTEIKADVRHKKSIRPKIVVVFKDGNFRQFDNLKDFCDILGLRKCKVSPSIKINEPGKRLRIIASNIKWSCAVYGIVKEVKIRRFEKWHIFRSGVEI